MVIILGKMCAVRDVCLAILLAEKVRPSQRAM